MTLDMAPGGLLVVLFYRSHLPMWEGRVWQNARELCHFVP